MLILPVPQTQAETTERASPFLQSSISTSQRMPAGEGFCKVYFAVFQQLLMLLRSRSVSGIPSAAEFSVGAALLLPRLPQALGGPPAPDLLSVPSQSYTDCWTPLSYKATEGHWAQSCMLGGWSDDQLLFYCFFPSDLFSEHSHFSRIPKQKLLHIPNPLGVSGLKTDKPCSSSWGYKSHFH